VHGGVRYLEQGQLGLVFESSAERRRLLRLAPHLVRPLEFTWPVYEGARVAGWKLAAGLTLYDLLALFRNVGRHRRLDAAGVIAREPALRRDGLTGGATYWDAATDDARLTLATALDAAAADAVVVNHADVTALLRERGAVAGARVSDRLTGQTVEVRARIVVNATGPWSDRVRALEEGAGAARAAVRGSKGVHILVPRERLGNRGAVTLLAPQDGRVFFVLPAEGYAVVGTTDTDTAASPEGVRASCADVEYLLEAANTFFPAARLGEGDVVSAWAGIRPLVAGETSSTSVRASREHAITRGAGGVISVTGGKLTTYRVMAAQVTDAVERALGRRARRTPTAERPLPGGLEPDRDALLAEVRRATGLEERIARRLAEAYGSEWRAVWELCDRVAGGRTPLVPELPYLAGELRWGAERELACTLADLLVRRTRVAFETRDHGRTVAARAAEIVAPALGWSESDVAGEIRRYEAEVERMFGIDS
jgi:glycerol-3-phosphate dehydrogenase